MVDANLFKARMSDEGLTQNALARLAGIAQSTLSLKIRNRRPMTLSEAEALARILSISDADFGRYFLYNQNCVAQPIVETAKPDRHA